MQKLGWYAFQIVVALLALWWVSTWANINEYGMAPGALAMFIAWLATGLLVRAIDARRTGWKASAPPPITPEEKSDGTSTVVKWSGWIIALLFGAGAASEFQKSNLNGAIIGIAGCLIAIFLSWIIRRLLPAWYGVASRGVVVGDETKSDGGGGPFIRRVGDSPEHVGRTRIGQDIRKLP